MYAHFICAKTESSFADMPSSDINGKKKGCSCCLLHTEMSIFIFSLRWPLKTCSGYWFFSVCLFHFLRLLYFPRLKSHSLLRVSNAGQTEREREKRVENGNTKRRIENGSRDRSQPRLVLEPDKAKSLSERKENLVLFQRDSDWRYFMRLSLLYATKLFCTYKVRDVQKACEASNNECVSFFSFDWFGNQ